jgi:hypothetical protein
MPVMWRSQKASAMKPMMVVTPVQSTLALFKTLMSFTWRNQATTTIRAMTTSLIMRHPRLCDCTFEQYRKPIGRFQDACAGSSGALKTEFCLYWRTKYANRSAVPL